MDYEFEIITYDRNLTKTVEQVTMPNIQSLQIYCRDLFGREYDLQLLRAFDMFDNVVCQYSRV